jgi:hypothetical protein
VTLDSSCALALVKEEAMESGKKKDYHRSESFSNWSIQRSGIYKQEKPVEGVSQEDKHTGSADDKLRALRQYHRARGLCDRCAEKWSYGHKCAPTIQLHVTQELLGLFHESEIEARPSELAQAVEDSCHLCMFPFEAAVQGVESPKSMRLIGQIQGCSIVILVDSGSSHTFIIAAVADGLSGLSSLHRMLPVQMANGARVACNTQLIGAVWTVT